MAKIADYIRSVVRRGSVLYDQRLQGFYGGLEGTHYDFADLIWYNICDLVTDIAENVEIEDATGARPLSDEGAKFAAFKAFYESYGCALMQKAFDCGFVVIGYDKTKGRFDLMVEGQDYTTPSKDDMTIVQPIDENVDAYVMKSATFLSKGRSDKAICRGWLDYLNDALNGSATICRKMGVTIMASPKNYTGNPTPIVLTKDQKKEMEKDMESYGSLRNQSIINLLPREMAFQVINLAGLDVKMQERVKTIILAIVDRIKVPANQVAIIDAMSNKQLANGSELREGDKLKYKTFRRLFERYFVDMSNHYRLHINYRIDGEPIGSDGLEVKAADE